MVSVESVIQKIDVNLLRDCNDVNNVDGILTDMRIPSAKNARIKFLYQFMGIKDVFCCGTLSEDEEYDTAKAELVYNYNGNPKPRRTQ